MILPLFPENNPHALLATLAEGVVLHQANGDIIFANEAATLILGLNQDQLLGCSPIDPRWHTIHEDGSAFPGHQHPAMVTLHTGEPQRAVIMGVRLPDEGLVWISINTQPLYQPQDHTLTGVIASFFDITDLKHTEHQLVAQLERSHLLNQITQGIRESLDLPTVMNTAVQEVRKLLATDRVVLYQFNPDWSGEFIAESVSAPQWSCLHTVITDTCFTEGYIQPYTLGRSRSISDIYESDLNPCHIQLLEQYQVRANVVVPVLQGSHLWGLLIAHHCTEPKAWDEWAIELMTQIANQLGIAIQQAQLHSQLQQTNAELHYQVEVRNAELRQMISYEQLLRVITDEVRASLNEEEILQAAVRELSLGLQLGNCTIGFLNPDQQTYVIKYEYALSLPTFEGSLGTVNPVDLPQLQKGETVYFSTAHPLYGWCTIVACPLKDDLELLGFLKLIRRPQQGFTQAERRLAEQVANQCTIGIRQARLYHSAQQQVYRLHELNQLKDEFVHMVSHELRTPLTNMKMALTMMEARPEPERQQRYLHLLKLEWQRELSLVNELLELLAMESGKRQLELEPLQLLEWIPTLTDSLQMRFLERQLQFVWLASPDLPLFTTDVRLLERILVELLNNACKYTPPLHQVHLEVSPHGCGIRLQVTNTGVEIPAEQLPKIFEKFHRVTALDRYQQGGTGLGLALVKKAVEFLQGQIHVTSREGHTCFQVDLPLL